MSAIIKPMCFRFAAFGIAVGAMFAAAPAFAQRASLSDRVTALEQQAASNQGNVDLLNQVNALKSEVAALRSQIEELRHEAEQGKSTSRAQYLDLDGRLNRLEGGAPATPAAAPQVEEEVPVYGAPVSSTGAPASSPPPATADERASYEAAFDVLKSGRYDESASAFLQFLQAHPEGSYAPNARYWLGESYYVTGNYQLALEQFRIVNERYPDHAKAPGALLKIGLSQYGLEQMGEAETTLSEVARRYPGSDAARTAEDRLRAIDLGMR